MTNRAAFGGTTELAGRCSAIKAFHLLLLLILAVHRRDLVVYHREAIGEDQLDIKYVAEPTRTAHADMLSALLNARKVISYRALEPFHTVSKFSEYLKCAAPPASPYPASYPWRRCALRVLACVASVGDFAAGDALNRRTA